MAILPIITWPDSRLKEISQAVTKVNSKTQKFMDDMLETMYAAHGIGLAAVQVGVLERILVMDINYASERYPQNEADTHEPLFLVNPKIVSSSNVTTKYKEGCLSFPGQYSNVVRPDEVTIEYLDYYGKKKLLKADGLLAICVQHEIDHLNGIVFVDHISKLKKEIILKKLVKQNKLQED